MAEQQTEQGTVGDSTTDWWRGFFATPQWVEMHSQIDREHTGAEIDTIIRHLDLAPGMHLLDIPCGLGRHAVELAARGIKVTGVDITQPLLDVARERAMMRGVEIALQQCDMRHISWEGEFDAVLCYWGSFGYFDDAGNLEFLRAVARSLKAGGRFLIDTQVAETLYSIFRVKGWTQHEQLYVLEERRIDHLNGRVDCEWTIFGHEKGTAKHRSSIRIYTYRQLCEMLREVGFTAFEGYNTMTGKPFTFGSSRLSLVATK
jgi:SAM-dependent methyltransferase